MPDDRIVQHLEYLKRYLLELKNLGKINRKSFFEDEINAFAAERLFQMAIEACINIGNRILSLEQTTQPIQPPEKYSDISLRLEQIKIIDHNFGKIFTKMIKFRNRLVHIYWEIDREELFSYLQNNLGDFETFISFVTIYLNKGEQK